MKVGNNLKLLRKNRKMSQEEVSKRLGLTRSTYSGYENGVAEPSLETMVQLSDFYKVGIDELVRKDFATFTEKDWSKIDKGVRVDTKGANLRVLTSVVSKENEEVIEMIPENARAGYASGYSDPEYISVLPTFSLPFLSKEKKYRSFPISGDSMPPVSHGSQVIAEYVQNWESIKEGKPYIIVTKNDGIVFKLIARVNGRQDVFQLISTNPLYAPYIVNVNDILEIWRFVNYISNDLPSVKLSDNQIAQSIKDLQKEVVNLKNQLLDS